MNVGEILSRAWKIIWRHKVLWIFGILAGCVNGGSGGSGNMQYRGGQEDITPQAQQFFNQIPQEQMVLIVIGVILVVLVITIIGIFLGTIGRIGLVRGTLQAERGAEKLIFGELFSGSMPYFWRVFGLNLLVGLVVMVFVIGLIVMGAIFATVTMGIGAICLIPFICLLVPLMWALAVWVEQSIIAIVVEDLGMMDGMRRGWEVIKNNVGNILLMWLILGILGLFVGFVIGLPMLAVAGPLFIALLSGSDQALGSGLILTLLCCVGYLPVLILLGGILRSYIESAWTLTFLRLTQPPAAPSFEPLPEATL